MAASLGRGDKSSASFMHMVTAHPFLVAEGLIRSYAATALKNGL